MIINIEKLAKTFTIKIDCFYYKIYFEGENIIQGKVYPLIEVGEKGLYVLEYMNKDTFLPQELLNDNCKILFNFYIRIGAEIDFSLYFENSEYTEEDVEMFGKLIKLIKKGINQIYLDK